MAPSAKGSISRRSFIKGTAACCAMTVVGLDPFYGTIRGAFASSGRDPERWFMSVCPYCGVGCGVEVGAAGGRVLAVRGMEDHPVNRGELCLLGKNLTGILYTEDRLKFPMIRDGGGFRRISWTDAIKKVSTRLKETIDEHGPDSFAMYVSASEYIEEYYIYNKFVKGCLGTNNLESSARLCWASGVVGLVKAFGADSPPCAYEDFELADLFFISGYNMASSKPVIFKRMMRARKKNSTRMIVVDPRRTDTASMADMHLRIRPGTDVLLHNAIANILIAEGLIDEAGARKLTANYDELKRHVKAFTPELASRVTGLGRDEILRAARAIGESKAALFMWGQGLNQSRIGTRKVTTLLNIVFITGNIGRPGAGPMAITGQTGAMGLREVGALPHLLPGFRLVTDSESREDVARIWGVDPARMSAHKGLPIPAVLKGVEEGKIKALWIIHSNPAATFPDTGWVRKVLSKVDFLVVQDCYHPTETTRYAHVLLPGAQWAEKGGATTNSERGLNIVERAVDPPGEARPDLEIVMDVARSMGFHGNFPYKNTEEIFNEYRLLTKGRPNDITGVTYGRLEKEKGLQWPVPSPEHRGTKRRFIDKKFPKGRLRLNIHNHDEPAEAPDKSYPLLLITGLLSFHYHSRTRTGKIEKLRRAAPEPFVEMHPADAEKYGLRDGDPVSVSSRRGVVKARLNVTEDVERGTVFMPYHFGYLAGEESAVNTLTNRAFDEFAGQPEFKASAVKVTRA